MKYEIKPSNQFKKDVKLAQKRGYDLGKLTTVIKSLQTVKRLNQNTETINSPAISVFAGNAIFNRIGC